MKSREGRLTLSNIHLPNRVNKSYNGTYLTTSSNIMQNANVDAIESSNLIDNYWDMIIDKTKISARKSKLLLNNKIN